MNNKTIIVTGASGSIGSEIVKSLLKKDFSVIMACRNLQKGEAVLSDILKEIQGKEEFVSLEELDLASLASVRRFSESISRKNIRLNGLMNNAGTINRHFSKTAEGFENTVGVNYIGIFLLTQQLLPLLEENSTIVNVTSIMSSPRKINKQFFEFSHQKFSQFSSYSQSKAALMLFTSSLAEQTKGKLFVNAADPGIVDSNMITMHRWFDPLADILFCPLIKSPKKGAIPLVNAQLSYQTGYLFYGNKSEPIPQKYNQHQLKEWLWKETKKIVCPDNGNGVNN